MPRLMSTTKFTAKLIFFSGGWHKWTVSPDKLPQITFFTSSTGVIGPNTILSRRPFQRSTFKLPQNLPPNSRSRPPRYHHTQAPERFQAFRDALQAHLHSSHDTPVALDCALHRVATHLLPFKPAPKGATVANRVQGTVKDMWNLRQAAQLYTANTLRPVTLLAQIRHWQTRLHI